jgi:hypothetical protein
MPLASRARRPLRALAVVGLIAVPACIDFQQGDAVDAEANVSSVRLTVGSQTIIVKGTGTVMGGPITITRPATPAISASFLNAAGAQDPVAHGGNFQLNATSADTSTLTFTRTSAFAGTLTGVAAGSTNLNVSLFHISGGDNDFGPFAVPVTVN